MSSQKKVKHNTRKLLMKGKSKKDVKDLVQPLVKETPKGATVPPFTVFLHMRRNVLVVSVPLHRVPEKIVHFEVDENRFLLDTTKFTRKPFHLEFTYPEGIKIDSSVVEGKIENGVFLATIGLVSVPASFQLKQSGEAESSPASRKRKRTAADESKSAAAAEEPQQQKQQQNGGQKAKQPKKKQKKASVDSAEKEIDARAVSMDVAMGLIDQVNAKEETQINQKLNKEKEKKAAQTAKDKEKRQKKQDKKQKIEKLVEELKKEKAEEEQEKRPLKKATPRRVSFKEAGAGKKSPSKNPQQPKKSALKKAAA